MLHREERTVRLEFDGVLFGLAIAEIARLPEGSRHLFVINFIHAGDAHTLALPATAPNHVTCDFTAVIGG